MISASQPSASRPSPRRWFRFSLRTFLLLTIVAGGICGWLLSVPRRVQHERRIVQQVKAGGGSVRYPHEGRIINGVPDSPPGPWLMRRLFGDDVYDHVSYVTVGPRDTAECSRHLHELPELVSIEVAATDVNDETMANIGRIRTLRWLDLHGVQNSQSLAHLKEVQELGTLLLKGRSIQDAALDSLPKLSNLNYLSLHETSVTSAAMHQLRELPGLQSLDIYDAVGIDDVALPQIGGIRHLKTLRLFGTSVSDEGLLHLQGLHSLWSLDLSRTLVTDAGLMHVAALKNLRELRITELASDSGLSALAGHPALAHLTISDSAITDEGMKSIATLKNLQTLRIVNTRIGMMGPCQVTDEGLLELKSLGNLEELWIDGNITREGAQRLHDHLPNCQIHGGINGTNNYFRVP